MIQRDYTKQVLTIQQGKHRDILLKSMTLLSKAKTRQIMKMWKILEEHVLISEVLEMLRVQISDISSMNSKKKEKKSQLWTLLS